MCPTPTAMETRSKAQASPLAAAINQHLQQFPCGALTTDNLSFLFLSEFIIQLLLF